MIDKIVADPFRGVNRGSLVRIVNGPKNHNGKEALVVDRELVASGVGEEGPIEDYEANIEVLVDGSRVRLWIGWVERILD